MKPPIAKQIPFTIERHGHKREDEFRWLKDENWKKICDDGSGCFANPEILQYVEAENAYTEHVMADTKGLQKTIYDELISRLKEDDTSVPTKDGPYYYYKRTEKGKNYPIYCRKPGLDAPEEIWMDVNKDAEPFEQYSLGAAKISPDHKQVLYAVNTTGSLNYSLKLRNLETGKESDWIIDETNGSLQWTNDNRHVFFVTRHPEHGRGHEVRLLDTEYGITELVFTKPEQFDSMFMSLGKTITKKWITINVGDHASNEIRLIDADDGKTWLQQPKLITPLVENIIYGIDHVDDKLYIHTNKDAINFKVMVTSLNALSSEHWQDYIPHQEDTYISYTTIHRSVAGQTFHIRQVTHNDRALASIILRNLATQKEYFVKMPEEAYDLDFEGAAEFITDTVRYTYESPVQPMQTIELSLKTRSALVYTKNILKTREVPNYDCSLYTTQRRFATGHDGAKIPITLMFRKDTPIDGTAPAFVYGYGSYGLGMTAYFSANRISLLDRGFVFAIAHIRGGDDKGYSWYLDGKLNKKKNTFLDFISCCEYLIDEKYTSKGNIVANGASAGGMLMGAIANMRPDLFKVVVNEVPFVDIMNTMEDTSLPLTASEWPEWGNPIESKEDYHYMLSYSPYDNIEAKDYPHMLYCSGISDEQVTYWEPTKMVARLRATKTDDNLLLLRMRMTAGHGGASKRYQAYEEIAFDYAFILKTLKVEATAQVVLQ